MVHDGIRRRLEEGEELLSPYAAKSRLTQGRVRAETPSPMRTEFQRDRDRIIHSKAFRRLKHKTQVFIAPLDDHYVTRLTHTLEVSQIARSIARALNLNEDLVEAISLGHDLGHTPFGHIGEEVLNDLYHRGFRHSEQSLRIVETIEKDGRGLNLTWEVREGILKHSKSREDIQGYFFDLPSTLEAQICRLADSVAYINHDIGDAIRAGLISEHALPFTAVAALGRSNAERINTMVCDIIDQSWSATGLTQDRAPVITMSTELLEVANDLRQFLFRHVYEVQTTLAETERAKEVIRNLYFYFINNQDRLPGEYNRGEDVERRVVDYIAGMTDNYAIRLAEDLGLLKVKHSGL
ncbi:MAG: deoxyguanosinetriphosphate triphosphohydrolase [Dehalococcoidia bacterium]|nr:MAG: deoxyguanosinetriphosphate triphosphohydrolase [Dehalococcoidia bacterium]